MKSRAAAASSDGTCIDLTVEEPSLWAPPTLQKAEAAVRYTGDQPPDYEERLDMLRDLRVWRDVKRFITAIGEDGVRRRCAEGKGRAACGRAAVASRVALSTGVEVGKLQDSP